MSEPATGATRAEMPPPDPRNASTAELVGGLTEQLGTPVQQAAPPLPTETTAGVQADVAAVKEGVSR